jgi:hypothetical protein
MSGLTLLTLLTLSVPETPFEYKYHFIRYEYEVLEHRSDPIRLG